jgi:hypothetical protein
LEKQTNDQKLKIKTYLYSMALTNKREDSLKQELAYTTSRLSTATLKLTRTQSKLDTVVKYGKICYEVITTYERKGLKKIKQVRTVEIACPN